MPSEVLVSMWMTAGGVIPAGWSLVAFEELLLHPKSMSVGVMYPGDDVSDGVPLIRVGDVKEGVVSGKPSMSVAHSVHEEYRRTELTGNELLITLVGDPGQCVVAEPYMNGWNVARALAVARLKDETIRGFLKALFRASPMRTIIRSMLNTTVQPTLNLKEIKSLPILVPPVEVRKEISTTLSAFDDKITLLRETNATLEAIAQALFKSWFVDFDPVRAKAEGRDPVGVPPEVADLFPSEFEDSELGEIPKGWRVGVFGELAKLGKGSINPMTSPDEVFEHYSLPAFDVSQLPVFELGQAIKSNKTRLVQNVVLQSKLNPHIPRVWLPYRVGDNAVSSTEFLPWMAQAPASQEFIYCLLTSTVFSADVRTLVTGTSNSHQRVRPEQVASLATVIPSASIMSAFEEMTKPLFRRVGENRQSSDTLAKLRDTLLPRLMSGKLRIPDLQAAVAEAAP